MNDYTPTTAEVRMAYGDARCVDPDAPAHSRGCLQGEEFDRWLAEHDRQVKAEAWAEGWKANSFLDPSDYGIANPYLNGDNK